MQLLHDAKILALSVAVSASTLSTIVAEDYISTRDQSNATTATQHSAIEKVSHKKVHNYYSTKAPSVPKPVRTVNTRTTSEPTPAPAGAVHEGDFMDSCATCDSCHNSSCNGSCKGHGNKARPTVWERFKYKWVNYWKPGLQESHWGYPEEFAEKPLGYYVMAHARTMVANGESARMTLYDYDFVENSEKLNARGMQQLEKIAYMLPRNYFPVVIESTADNPKLNMDRRATILEVLAQNNFPVPAERIIVGRSAAIGMDGNTATIINTNLGTDISTRGSFPAVDLNSTDITGGSGSN